MIGSLPAHHAVARIGVVALLSQLLQQGLVVLPMGVAQHPADLGPQVTKHELPGRGASRIEVVGADHRFHGVGHDRLLAAPAGTLLAAPDQEVLLQTQLQRPVVQGVLADHERLDARQLTFGAPPARGVELVADRQTQDRITEKLQLLIVGNGAGARLMRIGAVTQRQIEQTQVAEPGSRAALQAPQLSRPDAVHLRAALRYCAVLAAADEGHGSAPPAARRGGVAKLRRGVSGHARPPAGYLLLT